MTFDAQAPKPLPDALRGESWAFVALPLVGVKEEMESVARGKSVWRFVKHRPGFTRRHVDTGRRRLYGARGGFERMDERLRVERDYGGSGKFLHRFGNRRKRKLELRVLPKN